MVYKILLIGEPGVGKTQILQKFGSGEFTTSYLPTIGVDLQTYYLSRLSTDVNFIEIGGTSINDFFNFPPVIEGVDLVIFVCDHFTIQSSQLFSYLKMKIQEKNLRRVSFLIIRNKIDLVPFTCDELENLTQYSLIHQLTFLPITSKDEGCIDCLESFIFQIMEKSGLKTENTYSCLETIHEDALF
ncbi:ADP-ribosylation factor-like protein [Candidatus Lokiarchaeum ossiferum]|uniref:ADP-ribosylation factor-like protein n=1 Tax=Candidatus Lokiarchaeum ossiferum TaxID=2951803 RepID=UPI00352CA5AA